MCNLRSIRYFIKRGASVFSDASRGQYHSQSDAIARLKEEVFGNESHRSDDKRNLMSDRWNIERDVRKSFDEYILSNG